MPTLEPDSSIIPCFLVFGDLNCMVLLASLLTHIMPARKLKIPHPFLLVCFTYCQFPHQDLLPGAWILLPTFLYSQGYDAIFVYVYHLTKYTELTLCFIVGPIVFFQQGDIEILGSSDIASW